MNQPEPQHRTIALADGGVNLLDWGGDGPAIHFTHANGFNAETYVPLLGPLAGEARVLASDLRGHGFTTLPADPAAHTSWLTYPADLIRVLDAVGAGPYVLAGHSMGATSSLLVAAQRPDLVKALVLFEPVARSFPANLDREAMPLVMMTVKRRAVFPDVATVRRAYHGRGAFKTWPDEMLDAYLRGGLKPDPDGVRLACDPQWEAQNYRLGPSGIFEAVPTLRCPIAVFAGTVESTTGDEFLSLVRAHHPAARLETIEGATHFLPMEHPDLVRTAIRTALKA
ncbi:2-(acetamidomethylene)succinate hydrolase [Alphaproteobacteria bacterium SO-S41]|nr:2-(acetamidomethylene)succinate hydrolase [Alphaproteobacteria bacterium SO-S41]